MDIKGGIRYFKGSQFTNMLWLALEISGKRSKIENLSLYFAAYTGDERFWVSGNILLMAGQKKNPVKVKNPVKRSATPRWGAVCPEGTGVNPRRPELPHTPTWLWEGTPVKFLEFLQWVGALVFSCRQHINGKKGVQKLNEIKVLPQRPVKDFYESLCSWPTSMIVELKSLHHCETSQRGKQQTKNTTQLISQICLILLFKMYLSL